MAEDPEESDPSPDNDKPMASPESADSDSSIDSKDPTTQATASDQSDGSGTDTSSESNSSAAQPSDGQEHDPNETSESGVNSEDESTAGNDDEDAREPDEEPVDSNNQHQGFEDRGGDNEDSEANSDASIEDEIKYHEPDELGGHEELAQETDSSDSEDEAEESDQTQMYSGPLSSWDRSGPQEDREMPLADHIQEMLKRLAIVIGVAGLVSLVTFPFADYLINIIWNSTLPAGPTTRPRLYGILELKLTELKVASLFGLIVALPVFVYETYVFMRPGLYPHERRYYLAAVPTSLVLALIGVGFAYFIILPAIFTYFLYYSQDVATIGFALGRTFDLILLLMGYMALVFQIPLFVQLAMMMGLVTREWLAARRLLFWAAFLGISFIFSPDPTGMAPIIVALTMVVLFEGTLFLTKWTGRAKRRRKTRA